MSSGIYRTPVFPPFRSPGLRFVPTKGAPGRRLTIPLGKIEVRPEGLISWAEPTIFTIPLGVVELRGSSRITWTQHGQKQDPNTDLNLFILDALL